MSPRQRSGASVLYTELLHNGASDRGRTVGKLSDLGRTGFYTKLLHKRPIGLVLVGRTYHYRRRVPVDVMSVLGRREIWRSLGTDSYAVAVRRLYLTTTTVETVIEQARHSLGHAIDPKLLVTLNAPSRDGLSPACPTATSGHVPDTISLASPRALERSITAVYDQFLADPKQAWSKRTTVAHHTTRRWVIEVFGAQTPITDITRDGCRQIATSSKPGTTASGSKRALLSPKPERKNPPLDPMPASREIAYTRVNFQCKSTHCC